MTSEEIKNTNDYELLMLYEENDEEAKNILYAKYRFIIDIIIRKYKKYLSDLNIDLQEAYSEAFVGFSDGLKNYKDDRNAILPTFITLCVERRITALIKKYNREKYKVIKEAYSLDFEYEGENSLLDLIEDTENDPLKKITDKESYEDLYNKINKLLTNKEHDVFILMIKDLKYQEIEKILDLTPKQVDNRIQRIKNKIKKELINN